MQNNTNNLINYTENHLLWERTLNIFLQYYTNIFLEYK